MNWIIACLMIITGIVVYFPTIYIRKMNRLLKVLQEIEANTRAIVGTAAVQRLNPTAMAGRQHIA